MLILLVCVNVILCTKLENYNIIVLMKVIEILIYGLEMLEFPYEQSIKNCQLNA